jgi:ribosome-associated protein
VENKAENYIKLDSFLKLRQAVSTGGQAKLSIQNGEVKVNGQVETRRGRKLYPGDEVVFQGTVYKVG